MTAARHSGEKAAGGADGLPNYWKVFGLKESPFFQATLGDEPSRYPLELFVGRKAETEQLLASIGGASTSRQALGGAPGVGKTTLVQRAKAAAVEAGYWATRDLIPFHPDDTVESVMGRILSGIYEAVITARPMATDNKAMQRAQQYVRAFRMSGGGVSASVFGIGGGTSRSTAAVTPASGIMLEGPSLIRALLDLAAGAEAQGVVLHLNNLENLSERDLRAAADILRSLRDPVLLQKGLHVVLVGTAEAIASTVMAHQQVRSVFSITTLGSLPESDVQELLAERYRFLAIDPAVKVKPPVTKATVAELYSLFRGDLRGLLEALEEGVSALVGLVGKHPGAPIPLADLSEVLRARYSEIFTQTLSAVRQRQLQGWATKLGSTATPTQEELATLWNVKQPAVSTALTSLAEAGYVVPLQRKGLEPGRYAFTGTSRI
ncbi:MAG TPA: ATP-binding protein, partial [Gemmatimonadaceae bacterium]